MTNIDADSRLNCVLLRHIEKLLGLSLYCLSAGPSVNVADPQLLTGKHSFEEWTYLPEVKLLSPSA